MTVLVAWMETNKDGQAEPWEENYDVIALCSTVDQDGRLAQQPVIAVGGDLLTVDEARRLGHWGPDPLIEVVVCRSRQDYYSEELRDTMDRLSRLAQASYVARVAAGQEPDSDAHRHVHGPEAAEADTQG
jgi:hypothetical protein